MVFLLRYAERKWVRRSASRQAKRPAAGLLPVAVVTGGTEGIGRALAFEFAAHGHSLLLVARDEANLHETAAVLRDLHPAITVVICPADLTSDAGCAAVEAAVTANGLLADYLVNNAGMGACGAFAELDPGDLLDLVDLNIRAATDLMRRFLPGMIARGRGGVLNVASFGGFFPGPYQAAYYASKAYIVSLTEAVAYENRGRGVRIAALAPGPVPTAFHARMGSETSFNLAVPGVASAERVARIGYRNFMAWQTIIVPGVLPMVAGSVVRLIPSLFLLRPVGWILRPRQPRPKV